MKFEIDILGNLFDCEWFDETNFEELDGKISGGLGFIFNDKGEVCIVKCKEEQGWTFPGGGIEKEDKTHEDTFIRETLEEADLEIKDIKRVGYLTGVKKTEPDKKNISFRFVARVKEIKEQTIDPATGTIPERMFVSPDEVFNHVKWDSNGNYQLKKAMEKLNEE